METRKRTIKLDLHVMILQMNLHNFFNVLLEWILRKKQVQETDSSFKLTPAFDSSISPMPMCLVSEKAAE